MKLSEICVGKFMNDMAVGAIFGGKDSTTFCMEDGEKILSFLGHTYERRYGYVSAICAVRGYEDGKEIVLYDRNDRSVGPYEKEVIDTGSFDEILEYIDRHDCVVRECD